MKLTKVFSASLIIILSIVILSCTKNRGGGSAIIAPQIKMVTCMPTFFGSESIVMSPNFSVTNPNNFQIELRMDYQLSAGDQTVGKSMLPPFYVPAKTTVEVKDACVLPFNLFVTEKLLGLKSKDEAAKIVGTMWKGLSGARPGAVAEEVWKSLSDTKPVMTATGFAVALSGNLQEAFRFQTEWKE